MTDSDDMAARSKKLAKTILDALDEPESPERKAYEEQKDRDDREALDKFYALTGQKPQPPKGDARFYLRDGSVTDEATWSAKQDDPAYLQVDKTTLPNGLWVSTIWIGVDGVSPSNPSIFETAVFDDAIKKVVDRSRTATEPAAREAHRHLVEKWRTSGD